MSNMGQELGSFSLGFSSTWVFLGRQRRHLRRVCTAVVMWRGPKKVTSTGYCQFRPRRAVIVSIIYVLAFLNGDLKPNCDVE
jgi:hypothetical protein